MQFSDVFKELSLTVVNQKFRTGQKAKNKCQWSSETHMAYLYCHTHKLKEEEAQKLKVPEVRED